MPPAISVVDSRPALSARVLDEFLGLLRVVESRRRRVRVICRDTNGEQFAEFTVRSQCVEPGVMVGGKFYRDERLLRDAEWLSAVLRRFATKRLTSAQLSRKLVRSTSQVEEAEYELRALTARALLSIARAAAESGISIEFDRSGPKRGPVYSFSSIELLGAVGDDFADEVGGCDVSEAMTRFAAAVWNLRPASHIDGHNYFPVGGTQGDSTVDETLALCECAENFVALASHFGCDSHPGSPIAAHHSADGVSLAWVARGDAVTLGRFVGARTIAALGPSRRLAEPPD